MKNIFDYLITADNVLNEEVFDSFSHWMFEGDDRSNQLAREFLRWSVLFIMKDTGDRAPENEDFYAFFQQFDRTDLDAFLEHISKYGDIAVEIERVMGSDPSERTSKENESVYWYFFGTVMTHVEEENLFPGEEEESKSSKILPFAKDRAVSTDNENDEEGLSEDDLKGLSSIFSIVFVVLLVAFVIYNVLIKG